MPTAAPCVAPDCREKGRASSPAGPGWGRTGRPIGGASFDLEIAGRKLGGPGPSSGGGRQGPVQALAPRRGEPGWSSIAGHGASGVPRQANPSLPLRIGRATPTRPGTGSARTASALRRLHGVENLFPGPQSWLRAQRSLAPKKPLGRSFESGNRNFVSHFLCRRGPRDKLCGALRAEVQLRK